MKLEEYMRKTPREQWPKFIQEAADRAARLGKTVQQVLDDDRERLHAASHEPVPDEFS